MGKSKSKSKRCQKCSVKGCPNKLFQIVYKEICLCKEHCAEKKNLYVRKSNIEGSGRGLFAGPKGFVKDQRICRYGFKFNRGPDCGKENNCNSYSFCEDDVCWDARPFHKILARFANDARGSIFKNNADFLMINNVPYLVAKKKIGADEEIFVSYGNSYW